MKKKVIIITIIILLILLSIGGYKYYKYYQIKHAKIEITLNNTDVEFNTFVKVSDFIESINGTIVNDYEIDTTIIGKKEITFNYVNDDEIPITYSYNINIIDTTKPLIWMNNTVTIYKGNEFEYDNILCGDNYDDNPTCTVEGDYDINTIGNYNLKFIATDSSNNVTEKEFTLKVIEKTNGSYTPTTKTNTDYQTIYNKLKTDNTKIGIDVSGYQGIIDFQKLKAANVEFIIIKVGGTKGTDQDYYVDSKFLYNIEQANLYNIPVGIYFYSYADNIESSIKDANWVLEQIKNYKVDLPIAFDWENWTDFNSYDISFYKLTKIADSFLNTIKQANYDTMLYSSKTYLENMWLETTHQKWLAHYTSKSTYEGDYTYWQLCDNGKVDGIDADVDIDVMYIK